MLIMKRYNDIDGCSPVESYQIGNDYIKVSFRNRGVFKYTYKSAGRKNIERMKLFAALGDGLNSYIRSRVLFNYESSTI